MSRLCPDESYIISMSEELFPISFSSSTSGWNFVDYIAIRHRPGGMHSNPGCTHYNGPGYLSSIADNAQHVLHDVQLARLACTRVVFLDP